MLCVGARRGHGSGARRGRGGGRGSTAAKRGRGSGRTTGKRRGKRFQAPGSESEEDAGEADGDDEEYGGAKAGKRAAARKRLEPMLVADEDFLS